MRYEWMIALRYLRARRKQAFISWITLISTIGLVIGVMTLNIVLAVYTGFEEDLRDRILGFNPHLVVLSFSGGIRESAEVSRRIEAMPDIEAAGPFIYAQGMLSAATRVTGVVVRAVTSHSEKIISFHKYLIDGSAEALMQRDNLDVAADTESPPVLIGREVARKLGVKVGSTVTVISPAAQSTAVGLVPRSATFVVSGIFDSGMAEYDASLIYMALADAQKFFEMHDTVTGIEVRTTDMERAPEIAAAVAARIGFPYRVRNWREINHNLFAALELGKTVYFIVLLLIVLVAAFNIVSTLIMVVMEKKKDIAVLKSMGATRASIRRIFMSKGMIIGSVGTAAGSVLALIICLALQRYKFIELPRDVYGIDTLQVRLHPEYFVAVAVAALLICLLATIYPARQAARLTPVDVIRYE